MVGLLWWGKKEANNFITSFGKFGKENINRNKIYYEFAPNRGPPWHDTFFLMILALHIHTWYDTNSCSCGDCLLYNMIRRPMWLTFLVALTFCPIFNWLISLTSFSSFFLSKRVHKVVVLYVINIYIPEVN